MNVFPVPWAIVLFSPRELFIFTCHSTIMPDTSSLPLLRVQALIHGMCLTTLALWEQSASSQEKIMLLAGLTCMFSWTLAESVVDDVTTSSMLTAIIQTSSLLEVSRNTAGTMRLRMGTLSQEDSNDLPEIYYLRLRTSGLLLSQRRLESSFFDLLRSWTQGPLYSTMEMSSDSLTGGTEWNPNLTQVPLDFDVSMSQCLDCLNGLERICDRTS